MVGILHLCYNGGVLANLKIKWFHLTTDSNMHSRILLAMWRPRSQQTTGKYLMRPSQTTTSQKIRIGLGIGLSLNSNENNKRGHGSRQN